MLSTESSKERLTFFLDRQFFASLCFDLVSMLMTSFLGNSDVTCSLQAKNKLHIIPSI